MADSLYVFTFGIYKWKELEEVPSSYLKWIKGEDWFKDKFPKGHKAVLDELKYRERFGDPE